MDKLQLAHEYAKAITPHVELPMNKFVDLCFSYAEAMLAEEEKRKDKSLPEVLISVNKTFIDGVEQPRYAPENFVIGWHNIPDRFKYWAMDKDGTCILTVNKPTLSCSEWVIDCKDCGGDCYHYTGNFGYQGDWKESLRERP